MPKTLVYPGGLEDDAVAQYRLLLPAQALQAEGADVEVTRKGIQIVWNTNWEGLPAPPPHARVVAIAERPDCDTVVIQRPARRWFADIIPMLQKLGIRVVVDVDDDFNSIHKDNKAYSTYDPDEQYWHNRDWVTQACKDADLVTCSTPALLKAYGFGHGFVIPNFVPSRYLSISPILNREKTAGWTGKLDTHPKDLSVARGAIGDVLDAYGWHFHVLGKPDEQSALQEALGLREEPSIMHWVPFAEYPGRMAEVELGIVPLDDTRFNRAKSALKMMEYAALGVPVVGSATPDNMRMAEAGIGLTVKRPHHWRKTMERVVKNDEYRAELAGSGRERMANFTYEKNAWRWGFAWKLDGERIRNLGSIAS